MSRITTMPGKELLKWGILILTIYLNFTGFLSAVFSGISLVFVFADITVRTHMVLDVVLYIFQLVVLIVAIVLVITYLSKRKLKDYPRGLAIASISIMPLVLAVHYFAGIADTALIARFRDTMYLGEYSMFKSVFFVIQGFVNILTLLIAGLVIAIRD